MSIEVIIGILASTGTGIALLPQLIKLLKEKKTQDVSYVMLGFLFMGTALWTVYGILKQDPILIVSNAFSFGVNCIFCSLNLYYRKRD